MFKRHCISQGYKSCLKLKIKEPKKGNQSPVLHSIVNTNMAATSLKAIQGQLSYEGMFCRGFKRKKIYVSSLDWQENSDIREKFRAPFVFGFLVPLKNHVIINLHLSTKINMGATVYGVQKVIQGQLAHAGERGDECRDPGLRICT